MLQKELYKKTELENWDDFVAEKFASFLYRAYKGRDIPKGRDKHLVAEESIGADEIYSLEDAGKVVGMTAIKVFDNFTGFKRAVFVVDIAVSNENRGSGLSKELREWMVWELKPDIVLGVANNLVSVISRVKLFGKLGYKTYWGNVNVTGGSEDFDLDMIGRISKELIEKEFPKEVARYEDGVVPYLHADLWAEKFDGKINMDMKEVLERILEYQKKNDVPAMATLISIKG